MVIIIAGVIGIGKSTTAEKVAERYGTEVFYESVDDNVVLPLYYKDRKRWGFPLQIGFLNTRFRDIKKALKHDNNVLDRSIFEDYIFAYLNYLDGNMSKEEFDIYVDLLDNMLEEITKIRKGRPDILIYLDGSFETMITRIKKRGRDFEQDQELLDYYKRLHTAYKDWIANYDKSPKIVIDMDKYDLTIPEQCKEVMEIIDKAVNEITNT